MSDRGEFLGVCPKCHEEIAIFRDPDAPTGLGHGAQSLDLNPADFLLPKHNQPGGGVCLVFDDHPMSVRREERSLGGTGHRA